MQRQAKRLRLVTICLSLSCLLLPTATVWGQDEPTDDVTAGSASSDDVGEQVQAVEVPDMPGEANPDNQESVEFDPALLTERVFLPVIQAGDQMQGVGETNAEANDVVAAFTRAWTANPCTNVSNTERGLWDDMPGAGGVDNESGLLWFITNSAANENCSYSATIPNLVTSSGATTQLRFRVAVNDSALFTVTLYRNLPFVGCRPWVSYTTPNIQDDSQFRTFSYTLPAGSTICSVNIGLNDDPDSRAIGRTSALIDYVQLLNSATGAKFWEESFTGS